jgi:LysR family transcriptional regulator, transcriptional activator of nhaA
MEWLNYHHLRYFWAAAREGSVTRAAERLHISQPTVSAQIRELEEALGEKLFVREGRRLLPSEVGRVVFRYADEIFGLGQELLGSLRERPTGRPLKLTVGIADVVPKLIAYRLLEPALRLPEAVRLECVEDRPERLLGELAVHGLDLVLTDSPVPPAVKVRAYNHLLGECGVVIFGAPKLLGRARASFRQRLEKLPWLLPLPGSTLRRSLDDWFEGQGLRPLVAAEFADSALMKVFGEAGLGLFAAPAAIEKEIARQYHVRRLGVLTGVTERFYAVSVERRLKHPAVLAISEEARRRLFI